MKTMDCNQRYNQTGKSCRTCEAGESKKLYWSRVGAFVGLAGGTSLPLTGLIMMAAAWLIGDMDSILNKLGTMLLLTTVPLLIFGGFCMDIVEKTENNPDKK